MRPEDFEMHPGDDDLVRVHSVTGQFGSVFHKRDRIGKLMANEMLAVMPEAHRETLLCYTGWTVPRLVDPRHAGLLYDYVCELVQLDNAKLPEDAASIELTVTFRGETVHVQWGDRGGEHRCLGMVLAVMIRDYWRAKGEVVHV